MTNYLAPSTLPDPNGQRDPLSLAEVGRLPEQGWPPGLTRPALSRPALSRPAVLAHGAWQAFSGLVWPVRCPGCGAAGVPICAACRAAVAGPAFATPMVGWPLGWGA